MTPRRLRSVIHLQFPLARNRTVCRTPHQASLEGRFRQVTFCVQGVSAPPWMHFLPRSAGIRQLHKSTCVSARPWDGNIGLGCVHVLLVARSQKRISGIAEVHNSAIGQFRNRVALIAQRPFENMRPNETHSLFDTGTVQWRLPFPSRSRMTQRPSRCRTSSTVSLTSFLPPQAPKDP